MAAQGLGTLQTKDGDKLGVLLGIIIQKYNYFVFKFKYLFFDPCMSYYY